MFHPEDAVFDEFPNSLHDGIEGRSEADAYYRRQKHAGKRRDADGLAAGGGRSVMVGSLWDTIACRMRR